MKIRSEDLVNYSIVSFGLYPIMPNSLKGVFMITLFISSIYFFFNNKKKNIPVKPLLINSALFIFYLISMLYTTDLYYGFKKLGTAISMIYFPLIFFVLLGSFNLSKKTIYITMNLFSFSTLIFMIFFIFYFKNKVLISFPDISFFDINYIRTYIKLMPLIGHHPIYVSIFIGISIINIVSQSYFWFKNDKIFFFLLAVVLIFLIFSLFYLSSKGAIISLVIISVLFYFKEMSSRTKAIFFTIITVLFLIITIILSPQVNRRFKELFKEKTYTTGNIDINNSSQIRIAIWKTSIDNIKKAPMFGYGIGDVQSVLNNSYRDNFPYLLKEQHNSHNQFLGIWLSTGIIGLIIFLYFLFFNFNIALKNKDFIFLAILLFFCLNFLTENIIERQTGATLFFFFINLFGFYNYSNNKQFLKE